MFTAVGLSRNGVIGVALHWNMLRVLDQTRSNHSASPIIRLFKWIQPVRCKNATFRNDKKRIHLLKVPRQPLNEFLFSKTPRKWTNNCSTVLAKAIRLRREHHHSLPLITLWTFSSTWTDLFRQSQRSLTAVSRISHFYRIASTTSFNKQIGLLLISNKLSWKLKSIEVRC